MLVFDEPSDHSREFYTSGKPLDGPEIPSSQMKVGTLASGSGNWLPLQLTMIQNTLILKALATCDPTIACGGGGQLRSDLAVGSLKDD